MSTNVNRSPRGEMPEGEAFEQHIERRKRAGLVWSLVFQAATIVGIIALIALLYNILNQSFGLVAVENEVDPQALVYQVEEETILSMPNTVSSEDDTELADQIAGNPNAIGFFGYAYYQERSDELRALTVGGVEPSAESVNADEYPLSRPLFIYSSPTLLAENPQVADFIEFYLGNVNSVIDEVGYFAVEQNTLDAAVETLATVEGTDVEGTEAEAGTSIAIAGSSTVYPLTQRMVELYQESGYAGEITVENVGTKAGLLRLCNEADIQIANASRGILPGERSLCREADLDPMGFRVGTDALAIVVSEQNSFLEDVTPEEVQAIFTEAELWSDVNEAWPAEPIERFVPGADSGTLDFFVESSISRELSDMPKETLQAMLAAHVSEGLMRRFENDMPFAERSQENVHDLVQERVVNPEIVASWDAVESLLNRGEIELTALQKYPDAVLEWRSWVTMDFLTNPQSSNAGLAGIRIAILGSLWTVLITVLFALPIGVGAAVYLEEYADDNSLNRIIKTNIDNLAGVPSIIYGMLGLAIFVRGIEPLTSGALFGVADPTTANGRTILSAGLTLGLLVLPLVIINAQEAIRAVPSSLRQAGYGLGATKWQVIWNHVLPSALPGILTGNILSMSRAIGETAPLVVVGASTFIAVNPNGPFSKFTTLPVQIYQWTARPQAEFQHIAAAAIVVLLVLLLTLNASAILLRNRYSARA